jgi:hypothetical protein
MMQWNIGRLTVYWQSCVKHKARKCADEHERPSDSQQPLRGLVHRWIRPFVGMTPKPEESDPDLLNTLDGQGSKDPGCGRAALFELAQNHGGSTYSLLAKV